MPRPLTSLLPKSPIGRYLQLLLKQHAGYVRLARLHRPIGIWLLLWPTLWALWIAAEGVPDHRILFVFVLGTIVLRSAGCIINDYADRFIDPHVGRTRDRPLATGEVSVREALVLFVTLMLIGLGLVLTLNRLTQMLAVLGAAITVAYPFAKRFISTPQFVLGIAFSWGVPMAFAAQLGQVPRIGWLLFVVTMAWVVIYDTEYAMVDRDDDLKLGVKSTAILFGDLDRVFIGGFQLMFVLGLILVGQSTELGVWFLVGLVPAGLLMLYQQNLIKDRDPHRAFTAFLNNAWAGCFVFLGIVAAYYFRAF
ncbi:MAG TPA: 4-hydroxybenzoate octaprenyltransferase [Gammaproteobacteria bacterium]|nr:4-hydroxybenzoate octaprenyltransferase [Gammaproteobacteria bacterium]